MAKKTATESVDAAVLAAEKTEDGRSNLKLWRDVERTPPSMTKEVSFGRKYTAVDPHWQLRVCTAMWGPYGCNWGLKDLSYSVHDVTYLEKLAERHGGGYEPVTQTVVILSATFFYPTNDGTVYFPIVNDERFKAGDDVMKKLVTNTRSKALSWLGFSADVYLGKFDDVAYVKDMKTKFEQQDALVEAVMVKVPTSKTLEELKEHRNKLHRLIANKTLEDEVVARELLDLITEKEQELMSGG